MPTTPPRHSPTASARPSHRSLQPPSRCDVQGDVARLLPYALSHGVDSRRNGARHGLLNVSSLMMSLQGGFVWSLVAMVHPIDLATNIIFSCFLLLVGRVRIPARLSSRGHRESSNQQGGPDLIPGFW